MKTLQLSGKPYPIYEEGKITKTEVRLVGDNGLFIPVELLGDQTAKKANDLVGMALKAFVREYVTEYAVAESVQKVEAHEQELAELKKAKEEAEELLNMLKQNATNFKLVIAKNMELPEEDAALILWDTPEWQADTKYESGDLVRFDHLLFKVLVGHTSSIDAQPHTDTKNYAQISPSKVKVTSRPWDENDDWNKGDLTEFEGKTYESLQDNNAYSPSAKPEFWKLIEK